ncbi:hypothetical protein Selin_0981 [Desulfurispirillum indicum S5]|uniref:Lipoprotein n=1 Tax=Desulfurispirillum indicum (strain ATCC BAA-1389 / DSM 22839 / S5) TaxID=653733 RepID=E6W355_DESIS|nr:hypothetical protein [Desulfurispirillum indicum]ADU65716.1 hypothetical protein Selin_0981 [Desulfurispirillum indicum S5]
MKKNYLLFYLFVVISLYGCVYVDGKTPSNLQYLGQNFDQIYMDDYKLFWRILHDAASRARTCLDVSQTTEFIGLAKTMRGNAEFNEFLSEEIEMLAIDQTECFLSAWHNADEPTQAGVLRKLKSPLFIEPTALFKAFRPFAHGKYGEMVRYYLEAVP